jgi:tetratricopeptide (TPR) repeat protein
MLDRGSRTEACARGRAAAKQAVRLDPALAEALNALAAVKMVCDWDLAGAEADERSALELTPSFAEGHRVYAHLLVRRNRLAEAVQQARDGVELAPGSGVFLQTYAWTLYMSRMYKQADEGYHAAVETDPSVRIGLADTELQLHQYPEALADYRRAVTLADSSPASLAALGHALAVAGQRAAAIQLLAQLDDRAGRGPVAAIYRARIYAGLGDTQQTLRWLERAYLEHDYWLPVLDSDPDYDLLHPVPAFQALRRRIAETVPIR